MSVNINASTTNGLVLTSDTSGELKLQANGADIATVDSSGITMAAGKTIPAASLTGTLPAIDGSALTGISGPSFSAYSTTATNIPNAAYTKMIMNSEDWDTDSCFDTSTYRFTPNKAGYYQIMGSAGFAFSSKTMNGWIVVYKNGGTWKKGNRIFTNSTMPHCVVSTLVYLNGTTDYVELYFYQNSGSTTTTSATGSAENWFQGIWIRG